jgi:release factor glutamine methyltransferase
MTTEMLTVLDVLKKSTAFFAAKGIESPRLNAELLIGHALGLERMQLYLQFERLLVETELEKIRPLVRRRGQREPVQYIIGATEFHGLKLKVDRRALIPRPETEQLVELVVGACPAAPGRIIDLGTGSGAIALALASAFPAAIVTAVDTSAEALALARENVEACALGERVHVLHSNWLGGAPRGEFDLIVANPPYLTAEEMAEASPEVKAYEPHAALMALDEGLADLRQIIAAAPAHLKRGGMLALETGVSQHPTLHECLSAAGFTRATSHSDLAGRDRFVLATY